MSRPRTSTLRWLLCALLAVTASGATAEESPSDWFKRLQENRPFAALQALRQLPGQAQIAAQVGAFVGDETGGCALFGRSELPEGADYRDALDTIANMAAGRQIVMLNESHFRAAHRALLLRVIERLHPMGFDAIAVEALHGDAPDAPDAPDALRKAGIDVSTGFYTHDPVFAAALRRAQALGWTFVHYEATGDGDRASRETGQARNLAAWIARNPERRLLVYAGGSHISRIAEDGWMAARFINATGIEPLTIQQAATACPQSETIWPIESKRAQVAFRGGAPVKGAGDADLMVLHPPAAVQTAKSVLGATTLVCTPPVPRVTLLRAFALDDPPDAIPRDQSIVPAGSRATTLQLAPGPHRIEREHFDGRQTLGHITALPRAIETCVDPMPTDPTPGRGAPLDAAGPGA